MALLSSEQQLQGLQTFRSLPTSSPVNRPSYITLTMKMIPSPQSAVIDKLIWRCGCRPLWLASVLYYSIMMELNNNYCASACSITDLFRCLKIVAGGNPISVISSALLAKCFICKHRAECRRPRCLHLKRHYYCHYYYYVWYKIFASVTRRRMYNFLNANNNYRDKTTQKGFWTCKDGVQEHTDLLTHIIKDSKRYNKQLIITARFEKRFRRNTSRTHP